MQVFILIMQVFSGCLQLLTPVFRGFAKKYFSSSGSILLATSQNFPQLIALFNIIIYICGNHLYKMSNQDEHIEILKELSTLSPGTFQYSKGQYLVKTTARDVIEAGRRLEELGIFDFKSSKKEIKITVEYVKPGFTNVKSINKRKK